MRAGRTQLDLNWLRSILYLALALGLAAPVRAADPVEVTARVNSQRVFVGESLRLQISVAGSRAPSAPDVTGIQGFDVRFLGGQDVSRSFTSIVNGRRTDEVFNGYIFTYDLTATSPGERIIPAIEVPVDGKMLRTDPIAISVVKPQDDPEMKLRLEVDNPSPYEGEPVTLRLVWGVLREPSGPRFVVPGISDAFEVVGPARPATQEDPVIQALGVDVPLSQGQEMIDGQRYHTLVAEIILIPRRAGEIRIGPATLSCNLLSRRGRGFFDQDEFRRAGAESNELTINVKALPSDGRPPNFTGLVGRYTLDASASPTEVNVGDPITLRLRIMGPMAGNAPAPALSRQADLADDFRIAEDGGASGATRQFKEWSRTLRALRDDVSEIPPIELPYFDPTTQRYEIARTEPIRLEVRPTRVITAADAQGGFGSNIDSPQIEDVAGGIRHNYTGPTLLADQSFDLPRALMSPLGITAVAAPPLAYAGVGVFMLARRVGSRRETTRRRRRRALGRALETLRDADASRPVYDIVSAAIRGFMADCSARQAGALTTDECVALVGPRSPQAAQALRDILNRCDAARFGAAGDAFDAQLRVEAEALLRELDRVVEGGGS